MVLREANNASAFRPWSMSMSSRSRSSPFIVINPAAIFVSPTSIASTTSRVSLMSGHGTRAGARLTGTSRSRLVGDAPGVLDEIDLVQHHVERVGTDHCRVALRVLRRDATGQRSQQRPRRGMAELHDAVTLTRVARRGDDSMDAGRQHAVGDAFEHHA